jgi:hypothetical protein
VPIVKGDETYQVPDTKIVAPTKPVRRGKNIVISVAPVVGKPPGLVSYSFVWVISPKVDDLFTYPDNSKGSFGSGDASDPNHYDITLVANYLYADSEGKNPVLKTVEVAVGVDVDSPAPPAPAPLPTPDPIPTPTPAPVLPDGRFKLASFINTQVKTAGLAATDAQKLAVAIRGVISQNAGVPFKSKAEVIAATVAADRTALGSNLGTWIPTLDKLAQQLDALKLVAVADIIAAYDEVATGLEAIK